MSYRDLPDTLARIDDVLADEQREVRVELGELLTERLDVLADLVRLSQLEHQADDEARPADEPQPLIGAEAVEVATHTVSDDRWVLAPPVVGTSYAVDDVEDITALTRDQLDQRAEQLGISSWWRRATRRFTR